MNQNQKSQSRNRTVGPVGPPHWAKRLLERIAAPHLREEIQGDMDELFHKRGQRYGYGKARLLYVVDLFLLLHPRLWRPEPASKFKPRYTKYSDVSKPERRTDRTTSTFSPDHDTQLFKTRFSQPGQA